MEPKANFILVGIFALFSLIAAFTFFWWVDDFDEPRAKNLLDIRVEGSVSGLAAGSQVLFNGINVGRVQSVKLDPEIPNHVLVRAILTDDVPVRSDTFASIGTLGLTGRAYIRLEGGSPRGEKILEGDEIPVLYGSPSTLDNVMARLSAVATRSERIVANLETLVASNSPVISNTLANVEAFSKALAENSEGFGELFSGISEIAQSIGKLSDSLEGTVIHVEQVVKAVSPQKIEQGVDDLTATLAATRQFAESLDSEEFTKLVTDLRQTTNNIGNIFSTINGEQLNEILTSLARTTTMIEQVSSTVANRSNEIDSLILDVEAFTTDMRATAATLSTFIEQLGQITSGEESQGVLGSTQRTLDRFEKVLSTIEQNPESLIFGATPAIPESE